MKKSVKIKVTEKVFSRDIVDLGRDQLITEIVTSNRPCLIDSLRKMTVSKYPSDQVIAEIRSLLWLPKHLYINDYSNKRKFNIAYVTKVRLLKWVNSNVTNDINTLSAIFRINERSIRILLNSDASKSAILLDDYFINKVITIESLREQLKTIYKVNFTQEGLFNLSPADKHKLQNTLLRKMDIAMGQVCELFGGISFMDVVHFWYYDLVPPKFKITKPPTSDILKLNK